MNSGIYVITNEITKKFYVGSAKNIKKRNISHFYALRGNTHDNSLLQNAFNKYGEKSFQFTILEFCEIDKLIEREQYYIDHLQSCNREIGYNLSPTANSTLGLKFSAESKLKMSIAKKGLKPRLGKFHSDETKEKISKANKGKSHPQSEETKKKISKGNKGKKRTIEQKENYSKVKLNYHSKFPKNKTKLLTQEEKTIINKKKNLGENNGMSKLDIKTVELIRLDFDKNKLSIKTLTEKYNLNYGLVYKVVKRLRWNWL
jgi:group I intron endonuclease